LNMSDLQNTDLQILTIKMPTFKWLTIK
jgi:hypothetical protein